MRWDPERLSIWRAGGYHKRTSDPEKGSTREFVLKAEIRFAHLSDWHATTLVGGGRALWRPKRLSGWASWGFSRRHRHSLEVLEAAQRDVRAQGVDRILVTGDLTHVSLPQEFRAAARQLRELGTGNEVFLIPGNHDCYVPVPAEQSWDLWADYLQGDSPEAWPPEIAACLTTHAEAGRAPRHEDYPVLRIHAGLATIGLCSAIPTPIFRAGGWLGAAQLERLEALLVELGRRGFCRVVMIHHPVAAKGEPTRRALWDGDALRAVFARAGAELVVHGHKHRRRVNWLPGPGAKVPAIGVPSSSEVGSQPDKLAQYHIYSARPVEDPGAGRRFELSVEVREWHAESGAFQAAGEGFRLLEGFRLSEGFRSSEGGASTRTGADD